MPSDRMFTISDIVLQSTVACNFRVLVDCELTVKQPHILAHLLYLPAVR